MKIGCGGAGARLCSEPGLEASDWSPRGSPCPSGGTTSTQGPCLPPHFGILCPQSSPKASSSPLHIPAIPWLASAPSPPHYGSKVPNHPKLPPLGLTPRAGTFPCGPGALSTKTHLVLPQPQAKDTAGKPCTHTNTSATLPNPQPPGLSASAGQGYSNQKSQNTWMCVSTGQTRSHCFSQLRAAGKGLVLCKSLALHPPRMRGYKGVDGFCFGFAAAFQIEMSLAVLAIVTIPIVRGVLHSWEKDSKLSPSFRTCRLFFCHLLPCIYGAPCPQNS